MLGNMLIKKQVFFFFRQNQITKIKLLVSIQSSLDLHVFCANITVGYSFCRPGVSLKAFFVFVFFPFWAFLAVPFCFFSLVFFVNFGVSDSLLIIRYDWRDCFISLDSDCKESATTPFESRLENSASY